MGIAKFQVEEFTRRDAATNKHVAYGYFVAALYCDCLDSPYWWVAHPAVFRTKERAEAFMAKIIKATPRNVHMKHWGGPQYSVLN